MREILFRGQIRRHGQKVNALTGEKLPSKWVYGGVLQGSGTFSIIYGCDNPDQDGNIEKNPVYTETLGQYTGLKDKNGKRIFEGDIVQIWWEGQEEKEDAEPTKYKAVVEFGNPNCEYDWGYQLRSIDYIPFNKSILLWVDCEETGAYCEAIGNIHDNPELIAEVSE